MNFKRTLSSALGAMTIIMATALTAQEATPPVPPNLQEELVSVNGKSLTRQMLLLYTQRRLADRSAQRGQNGAVPNLMNDLIALEVMAQQAEKEKLADDAALTIMVDLQRKNLLAQALMQRYLRDNPITEADLHAAYERVKQRVYGTQYQVSHIQVSEEEKAQALLQQLADGGDFAALAKEHSTDTTRESSGELGWVRSAQLPPEIGTVVEAMQPNTVAQQPVKTTLGWHVIRLGETREQPVPGFEESRETLQNLVRNSRLQAFVGGLTKAAKIARPQPGPLPPKQ